MKKFILLVVVFIAAGILAWKLLRDKPAQATPPKDDALRISKNPETFNVSFESMLQQYFVLRDDLADWDTVKADVAAFALAGKVDSLPIRQIKADTGIILTAQSVAAELSGNAKGFADKPGIENRRQIFNTMTDNLYNLVRAVRYDKEIIYHMRCPMAFSDSIEGFWLSDNSRIINPYLGNKHPLYKNKMIGCGEIVDSFNLVSKH